MSSEAGRSRAQSSNARINEFLTKIDEKSRLLKANGLTRSDQQLLKDNRLKLIWGEPDKRPDGEGLSATTWRRARARRIYAEIQNLSNHLFLAFILVIPPTTCTKASFNGVLEYLTRLESYEQYHLDLSSSTKKFFESTAVEQGFIGNRDYLHLIQVLFPQKDEPRREQEIVSTQNVTNPGTSDIQFAYSLIRFEDIPAFFENIQRGICTSQQAKKEEEKGLKTSSCVTVFVPAGEKDGTCNIVIDREVVMNAIRRFELSDLKI